MSDGGETAELRIVAATATDRKFIDAAIELGDAARATVGQLPYAVYEDAADKGTLLLALVSDHVVGYALVGLAKERVRLTHLVVAPGWQGRGVARVLVDELSRRYSNYFGILVRCRHDYGLGPMWIRLGFSRLSERPGRGKDREPLTAWWRDHDYANLLTSSSDAALVRAAIDLNVLRNLVDVQRSGYDETMVLDADHLADRLELYRTAALDAEIESMDGPLRARCMSRAQLVRQAPRDSARLASVRETLREQAIQMAPGYPRTAQDAHDLEHVATAIAGGLNVFVTLDKQLTDLLGAEAARCGLRIMRPADVAVWIDELSRAESYRPVQLRNTAYSERLLGSGEDHLVESLASVATGEKPRALHQTARRLGLEGGDRWGVFGPGNDLLAIFGLALSGPTLRVPILRVTDQVIGQTLIRQILFRIRQIAVERSTTTIAIDTRWLSATTFAAAVEDGFLESDGLLYAFVLKVAASASEVEHQAVLAARAAGLPAPVSLRSRMPALTAATLERTWWPAKILDSELISYLVPIQQQYSVELLGVPPVLLARQDALGLSREHVYYRSPTGLRFQPPGRILWYMSVGGGALAAPAAIVACSLLETVDVGPPDELYSRFQHLGVWRLDEITRAASEGKVQALRFTNTEIFAEPVLRRRFSELAATHGASATPPLGPRTIPSELFSAICQEGAGR